MSGNMAQPAYGINRPEDIARLARQNGVFPEDHAFEASSSVPSMCRVCFATRSDLAPWHINVWDAGSLYVAGAA